MILSVLLAGVVTAASSATGRQSPTGYVTVTSTPPAKGDVGTVTWDLPYGEPSTLDWLNAAAYSENTVLSNLCEGLMRTNPNLEVGPALASSVSHPNALTWVYKLRRGVTFWDGKPLTVADVVFSLRRTASPKSAAFWTHPTFDNVKSITPGPGFAVTVHLTKPDALFPEMIATAAGTIGERAYILAKGKTYGTARGGVMCTGPFMLKKWTPGSGVTIVRNPHYWDTAHRAKAAEIDFKFLTDPSTITNALLSGQIDGAFEAPISAVQKLRTSSVGKLYVGKSTEFVSLTHTLKRGPMRNVLIRHALSLAISRDQIASAIFQGTATPILAFGPPDLWSYANSTFTAGYNQLPSTAVDLDKAKQLVKQAGSPKQSMSLLVNADDVAATQTATLIQAAATSIGLNVKIDPLPAAQTIAISFDPKRAAQYDMIVYVSSYSDVADPLEFNLSVLHTGGAFNGNGYSNKRVDRLVDEARATLDPTRRAQLINAAQAQGLGRDLKMICLDTYGERLFMNNRITGAVPSLPSELYFPWARDLGSAK
jgi:peptide/nickel transport system substrate-binding protein